MKLKHLFDSLRADIETVATALDINIPTADDGKTGLKTMYSLLDIISRNRAYDDEHPSFKSGLWKRMLPFDGRPYCFYYADGANDTHVATLLKAIKASFKSNSFPYPTSLDDLPPGTPYVVTNGGLRYGCPDSCWQDHFRKWQQSLNSPEGPGPMPMPYGHVTLAARAV